MNVLLISPHYPPNFVRFAVQLRRAGANVLAITDAPTESLPGELRATVADHYYVPHMEDYDAMCRAVGWLIHRHGRIGRLDSHNEHWLEIEARLREDFNVPGQRPSDTEVNRSKWAMKQRCREHDLLYIEGEPYTDDEALRAFADRVGFPVILKPEVGVGAARTFRASSDEELARALREPLDGYLVERFATGDLVSFDGITDRSGEVIFFTSHEFSAGIMDIVNERQHMEYRSMRRVHPALEETGRRTVRAFGIKERFFHIEYFREPGDQYRLLEVNVRPPGLLSIDMMNFACDIDLYAAWARLVTTGDAGLGAWQRRYHVSHVGRRAHLAYAHGHEEILRHLGDRLVYYGEVPHAFTPAMGEYCYLVRNPDLDGLWEDIGFCSEPHYRRP